MKASFHRQGVLYIIGIHYVINFQHPFVSLWTVSDCGAHAVMSLILDSNNASEEAFPGVWPLAA